TACKDLIKRKILKNNPDATFSDLENLDCWTLALSAFDIDAFHLIRGFIPSSLTRSVQVLTRNQQKTNKIILKGISLLQDTLRTSVWMDRCTKVVNWEKVNNISSQMKKSITTGAVNYKLIQHQLRHLTDSYTVNSFFDWSKHAVMYGFSW